MGQLEKYGLYVLVVVIVLILGVAIWGGEQPVPRGDLAAMSTHGSAEQQEGARRPGRFDRIDRDAPYVEELPAHRGGTDDPGAGLDGGRGTTPSPRFLDDADRTDADRTDSGAAPDPGSAGGLGSPTDLLADRGGEQPVAPPGSEPRPSAPRETEHVLGEGETLGEVARRYLGSSSRWTDLAKWNGIEDPRRVRAGTRLVIRAAAGAGSDAPAPVGMAPSPGPAAAGAGREYVVRSGDSLSKIAERELGSQRHVDALRTANGLDNDLIRVGQKLVIPNLAATGTRE